MYCGTFFASQRRDDDDDGGMTPKVSPEARERRRQPAVTHGNFGPEAVANIPPNWKLMLGMVCFPKKPLYAHHLPNLLVLRLHPPTPVRVVSRNPVLA
jgi:hypothetical protein